ncbi:MAG: hypothetical protein ACLGHT_00525 [Acidimicrobiia bacterium]
MTENARDYERIVSDWSALGEHHRGGIFTSPRAYHRGSKARSFPGFPGTRGCVR